MITTQMQPPLYASKFGTNVLVEFTMTSLKEADDTFPLVPDEEINRWIS